LVPVEIFDDETNYVAALCGIQLLPDKRISTKRERFAIFIGDLCRATGSDVEPFLQ
jgi:hypothetical protein